MQRGARAHWGAGILGRDQSKVRAEWGGFQAAPGNPACVLRAVSADNHRTGRLPASRLDLYRIVRG